MNKKFLIVMSMGLILTGCDLVNKLKYQYYYNYRGKISCVIDQEVGVVTSSRLNQNILVEDLSAQSPTVSIEGVSAKFSKIVENDKMLNLQKIDLNTGASHVMLIHKDKGLMLYQILGLENDELVYRSYRAHCQ